MLTVVSIDEAERWDGIVRSFENWDVYYLSGYSRAFQLHGDGDPILVYHEDAGIRAINVVMKRDIQKDRNFANVLLAGSCFDLTTPYGYGGFLVEGDTSPTVLMGLDDGYTSFCRREGIVSEFVRFHPVLRNSRALANIYDVSTLGKTILVRLESPKQVWDGLTGENRNMIRKAQKAGVEVFQGRSEDLYREFGRLYSSTMDRCDAADYYYFQEDFFKSVLNDLRSNALVFYAVCQGRTVAMAIILFGNTGMHYHLSASDLEHRPLAPTNLLLYEAACWGCQNGYKWFHLGGGVGSTEDSLYKFKRAFNRESDATFEVGRKVFDRQKYDELVEMRSGEVGTDGASAFFPKYRAAFGA